MNEDIAMIDRDNIILYIKNNKETLTRKYHLSKIGFFGSFARNDINEDSDIDIIVEFDNNTDNIYEIKNQLADLFKNEFHRNIDIAREKYLKPRIKEHILKETMYV